MQSKGWSRRRCWRVARRDFIRWVVGTLGCFPHNCRGVLCSGWRRGEKRDSTTTPYDPHTTRIPKAEAGSVDSYGFSPYSCLRDGCLTNAPRSGMLTYRRLIGLGVAIQYALRRPFVPTQTLSDYSTACPDVHLFWFDRKRSDPFEGPTDAVAEQTVLGEQGGLPTSIPFSPRVITIRAAKAVQQYLGRDHSSDDG